MSDRIQRALDGELPREALGPSERRELDRYDDAIDSALAGVRAEAVPDVTARVMERISALPGQRRARRAPGWRRGLEWLWAPRPVALRPAWGLAAAAIAAVLVAAPIGDRPGTGGGAVAGGPDALAGSSAAAAAQPVFVHFRLDAAGARTVELAADFTDWRPAYTLHETAPGVWTVVVPVSPGVHQYAFVIDGERWVADPLAPKVDDGFGGTNSRLDVVTTEPRRAL